MRDARTQIIGLIAIALLAPLVACAAGTMSLDVASGPVGPESESNDSGAALADTGTSTTNLPPPSSTSTPPSDDAGSSSGDDSAAPTGEDSSAPVEDSAPPPPPPPPVDSGSSCPGYAPPTTSAGCECSATGSETCTANNCYNGYYCELSDNKCVKKPSSC
jgi:hypothetical protein